jgi:hypothetical protein
VGLFRAYIYPVWKTPRLLSDSKVSAKVIIGWRAPLANLVEDDNYGLD